MTRTAAAESSAPRLARISAIDRLLALGSVDPEGDPACEAEEREADLHVHVAAPERSDAKERQERPDRERGAQRVDRGCEVEVAGIAISPRIDATTNAIETGRRLDPGTRPTRGRAMAMRRTNRPIAAITVRNIAHRATTSRVVVAVPEIFGTTNCGWVPRSGRRRT